MVEEFERGRRLLSVYFASLRLLRSFSDNSEMRKPQRSREYNLWNDRDNLGKHRIFWWGGRGVISLTKLAR
jgi:hypothetical protein